MENGIIVPSIRCFVINQAFVAFSRSFSYQFDQSICIPCIIFPWVFLFWVILSWVTLPRGTTSFIHPSWIIFLCNLSLGYVFLCNIVQHWGKILSSFTPGLTLPFVILPWVICPNIVRHWVIILWVIIQSDFTPGSLTLGNL